ncbi:hypothetical protein [uncultured Ruminococcus sp.]|uniref:hypothetical protein n=1 Tax=uncultured Ruminococcus sp. TaxID=165186 RepID=UPI002605E4C8|nr:hypothetical protein [uncultured Ruminococcus sp.]
MENRIKKVLSVLSVLGILSMSSRTAYAAESDDPELYELAYSLGADKDYLGVPNYSHDDEGRPFNNDCYVDFLHHCSLLEAAYAPQETYRSVISSGSCMGISILEVLAHNGVIKPSDIQEGAETLSEITHNERSDRYITDYQSLQAYTLLDSYEKYLLTSMTYEDQIDRLIEIAERCMNDDKYFLITFRNQSRAHAICGIGIKDGSWTFNDTSYDKCILTLDSNERDKDNNNVAGGFNNQRCIYINSETKQSYIPTYNVSSDDDPYVRFCAICDDTKAKAVYEYMRQNGSGTCVNHACRTYEICHDIGIGCYIVWTDAGMYGHTANIVNVDGIWYVLDTKGGYFLDYNYCFTEVVDIDGNHIADGSIISDMSYDELH